ncbi:MAG TPA: arsenite methyltransferase [Terriglobales bacterium]|nr:arsenite methyltransferase [Terriglobales bacterium]
MSTAKDVGGTAASQERDHLVEAVRARYGNIAREKSGCGCSPSAGPAAIGYSAEDLASAGSANLGLGCGNPLALAAIQPGMTVLDLGSGAGFDAFLAQKQVGPSGRVIGVDMTEEMLNLARENARRLGADNVEFRKGYIEHLPLEDDAVDLAISNCVINLSADKPAVFRELFRVLKPGGQISISDIVLLRPLPEAIAADVNAYVGCIAGASLLGDYLDIAFQAGFRELSLPQITSGRDLLHALTPGEQASAVEQRFGAEALREAAAAVVSAKLHGRKPRNS